MKMPHAKLLSRGTKNTNSENALTCLPTGVPENPDPECPIQPALSLPKWVNVGHDGKCKILIII